MRRKERYVLGREEERLKYELKEKILMNLVFRKHKFNFILQCQIF